MNENNPYELGQTILIDKPYDWTSFDVVRKIRTVSKAKKVGHAGTLDPLATGLLIICTGKFTKKINLYMEKEKEYTGTIILGAVTPTFDLESIPEQPKDPGNITADQIHAAAKQYTGEMLQVPPVHSAVKIGGKRVYELARKGKEIMLEPRKVTIHTFNIVQIKLPAIDFRVVCSTGTYIRSLANDFGQALGCGGYLGNLCRTRIGEYKLEEALTIDKAIQQILSSNQKG